MLSKIKSFLYINRFSVITLFIALFCISYFCYNLRYAIVGGEDVPLYLIDQHFYSHARYPYIFFNFLFVKLIPDFFNINIQNFAFVSETLTKSILYYVLVYVIVNGFFTTKTAKKSSLKKYKSFLLKNSLIILTFFSLFAIFNREFFLENLIDTLIWFNSYVFPISFILLLYYKLINIYVCEEDLTKTNIIIIVLSTILSAFGSENLLFIQSLFLIVLLFDVYFLRRKFLSDSRLINYSQILIKILLLSVLIGILIVFSRDSVAMYNHHQIQFSDFSFEQFLIFFKAFFSKILAANFMFYIIIFASFIILFLQKKIDIIKITSYFLFAHIVFFLLLMFVPWTCFYAEREIYKIWLYNPPFLVEYAVILYAISLYLVLNLLYSLNIQKFIRVSFFVLYLISTLSLIHKHYTSHFVEEMYFLTKESKTTLYISDKIYLNNIKNNVPINNCFLNSDNMYNIVGMFSVEKDVYIRYLKNVYKIPEDTIKSINTVCMSNDEYISKYYNSSVKFEEDELLKLDFSKLSISELE